jgi:hypothetical protein
VRTFQIQDRFGVVFASSAQGGERGQARAASTVGRALGMMQRGEMPADVTEALTRRSPVTSPGGDEVAFSVLHVSGGGEASLVECDTVPLCLIRGGEVAFLPLSEEVVHGRLLRGYRFQLRDGDYMVMVSQGYLHPRGWGWGWSDIAVAVRRWTDTGCDAEELMSALLRTYHRLNPGAPRWDVTVVAMRVRPERHATVWTGPPADQAQDEVALGKLMAEQGTRVICGGTTALIAARLLGAELKTEPRPEDGWAEVPPVSSLEEVDLVTEGLVTLGKARERLAGAGRVQRTHDNQPSRGGSPHPRQRPHLPRGEDGATRLARALLAADRIHFVVGLAVNPQQADDSGTHGRTTNVRPLRQGVVEDLAGDLKARGKLVSVEYL